MQIITKDTTWAAGQVINLTEDVQVAPGVTLTIAPGAQITGRPWVLPVENPPNIYIPVNLQVYGTLKAQGTFGSEILFNNVILKLSDDSNYNGNLLLDRVEIKGVPISPPTGNGVYGSFNLTNSVIHDAGSGGGDYWYAWYPLGSNKISNNIFIREQVISLGISSGSIEISNNIFDFYTYGAVTEWAAYGSTPILSNNAYLMSRSPTLALNYDGKLISNGDYFGGATQDQISQMIYDRNDTLSISNYVELKNVRTSPGPNLPTDIFTYTGVQMPSDIVKTGRVIGSDNVGITGNKLDNIFFGNSGNNAFDGKAGIDTVVMHGKSSEYILTDLHGGITSYFQIKDNIVGRDGTDTLSDIEHIQFTDGTIAADLKVTADTALIYRLYQAAFARMPDEGGLRYWTSQIDVNSINSPYNNAKINTIAQSFLLAPEFTKKYGSNLTNAQYVDQLYLNVLGRMGETDGVNYWNGLLDTNKATRDTVLIGFAASPENVKSTATHIDHGFFIG